MTNNSNFKLPNTTLYMKSTILTILLFCLMQISVTQTVQVNVKVLLEGPFFNGQMTPLLNDGDFLPNNQPYNEFPWNYNGTEYFEAVPSVEVVDWVLIDLLEESANSENQTFELINRRAGLLLGNGTITDLDGSSVLTINTDLTSGFHVKIHHRNHLPVISSAVLLEDQGIFDYDFTTGQEQSVGGVLSLKLMSSGIWGMIAADGNMNGQIDNIDKNEIWVSEAANSGYLDGDFNMDGYVDNTDLTGKWALNAGQGNNRVYDYIRHCSGNGRYFCYGGKAVLLTGSHTWDNFQDIGIAFDYSDYLNWMEGLNHNFMRMWAWESPKGSDWAIEQNLDISPIAYKSVGNKYDVEQLNQNYFDRLQQRIRLADEKGIYVAVMLFEGFSAEHTPMAWNNHPFNAGNNINGIGVGQYDVHTNLDAAVLQAQKLYVREVIDIVNYNKFGNVLYEIGNEIPYSIDSDVWQNDMIDFIHTYEFETYGVSRPVGKTYQYSTGFNESLFSSPADWVSPNSEGGYDCREGDAPIASGSKVIISDTDHFYYIWYSNTGYPIDYVWKSFTGGINPIHMDNWGGGSNIPGRLLGQNVSTTFLKVRANMGYAKELSERMDLISTAPQPSLSSSGFCIASANEYVVYLPQYVNNATVDLSSSSGQFAVEWLDAETGTLLPDGNITAGSSHSFNSPFGDYSILYLKKVN